MKTKQAENGASLEIRSLLKGQLLSYLVGFYLLAFYLELHFRIEILQTIRFQFFYGALIGILCILKTLNDRKTIAIETATKQAILLIVTLGIYTVFSMDRATSIDVYVDRVLKFAVVAYFIYSAVDTIEDLRVVLGFTLLAWLKIGSEGFIGWYWGGLMWENQGIQRLHGSTPMFGHPNSFSGFAVGCLPFCAFLIINLKSHLLKLGLVSLTIFALIIIVTTGSRTGYVATILGILFFFSRLQSGKFRILLISILIAAFSLIFIPKEYQERFESIFTGQEKEGSSSSTRMIIFKDALSILSTYPMGIGVQAFPKVRTETFGRSQDTHNLYLEILTNIGPFGFLFFSLFIRKLFIICKNNAKVARDLNRSNQLNNYDSAFLVGLCYAISTFIFVRLVLGLFGMDLYEIYWWFAFGLTLAVSKIVFIKKQMLKESQ